MISRALIIQFNYNKFVMDKNLEGITNGDSLQQPQQSGNCINWILGHIVWTRNIILRLLGESPVWTNKASERYKRGAEALTNPSEAVPLDEIVQLFDGGQEKIVKALKRLSPEDFEKLLDDGKETLGTQLAGLSFHESYHAGQIGILRRVIGKEGILT